MGFNFVRDLPDLSGKVIIVTGSTSGIGFATAQSLVRKGAKVYLAARNEAKATACINRIIDAGTGPGHGQALYHPLDLSNPKVAKKSAEDFLQKETRLDILINNAAIIIADYQVGFEGMPEITVVNHFSPFVFTISLLPLLKSTAAKPGSDVRIVNVSAHGHKLVPDRLHFKTKEDYAVSFNGKPMEALKRYSVTKLLVILWSKELQRRLSEEGSGILVLSLHPGVIFTEQTISTAHRFPWPLPYFLIFFSWIFMAGPLKGATPVLVAGAAARVRANAEKYRGAYLDTSGEVSNKLSKQAADAGLGREVWESTQMLLKEWDVLSS